MASITKTKNGRYLVQVDISIDYIRYRDSKTFDNKNDAQIWGAKREKQIREGQTTNYDYSKNLKHALIRYRDEVCPKKRGGDKEALRINAMLRDPNMNKRIRLNRLTPDFFIQWRDTREVGNSSKNKEISLLRAVLETARRSWCWIDKNPLKEIHRLPEPPPRSRRISQIEQSIIVEELGFDWHYPRTKKAIIGACFLFALETAMRRSEILNLDWSQVFLREQYCTLLMTKNGDRRDVPLSSKAIDILQTMIPKRQGIIFNVKATTFDTMFRKAVRDCQIVDLNFHDTRHEACTQLASKLNVLELARMIGHRDPRSLMIYFNPTASELAKKLG